MKAGEEMGYIQARVRRRGWGRQGRRERGTLKFRNGQVNVGRACPKSGDWRRTQTQASRRVIW